VLLPLVRVLFVFVVIARKSVLLVLVAISINYFARSRKDRALAFANGKGNGLRGANKLTRCFSRIHVKSNVVPSKRRGRREREREREQSGEIQGGWQVTKSGV